jgi:hypothetical protein
VPFYKFDDIIKALTSGQGALMPYQKTGGGSSITAGSFFSLWPLVGIPSAGGYPGVALQAAQQDDTTAGAMSFGVPPTGTRHLLHWTLCAANNTGQAMFFLLDRLLVYPAISHTTVALQTFTNPVGLPRYTDGNGVMAFLEVTTLLGTGTITGTLSYTNTLGQPKTTTFTVSPSAIVGQTMPIVQLFIPLAAGDLGILSVQSVQFGGTQTAGVSALILARPISFTPVLANGAATRDFVTQVAALEQLMDHHCLMMAAVSSAAFISGTYFGQLKSAYN